MFPTLARWVSSPFVTIGIVLLLLATTLGVAESKKNKKPDATGVLEASNACLGDARGAIKIFKKGNVEKMTVSVKGLPPRTEFDVFVIQQPTPKFGLSWYQGGLTTDKNGKGSQNFVGRFSLETFIVAPDNESISIRPHPSGEFPDEAGDNPTTLPVHTYHVGLWFNSPDDAEAIGCPDTETPFNGDHTAGIQALRTQNVIVEINGVPRNAGPLAQIQ